MADRRLKFRLLLAGALFISGCRGATVAPMAAPTVVPTVAPTIAPTTAPTAAPTTGPTVDRTGVRDAALEYVRDRYGADAPAADLTWTEQNAKPAEMVGREVYQYLAGDWLIEVSYPVVLPELTVYTVKMANMVTGFGWEGQVGAGGQVIEGEQLMLNAFNVALTHALALDEDKAPPASLAWVGERTTPADMVGAETYRYTAGDWVVTIAYPVVSADMMVFNITIQNPVTGFVWMGSVDTNGQVVEIQ